ncbi:MAG TPA: hypothetical protein VGN33_02775 [Leifsonia sp.]|nr:hypothetical protein [Leifsonia sp.]
MGSAAPARADTPAPAAPAATASPTPTPAAPTIDDLGGHLARFPLTVTGRGEAGDHLEISGASGSNTCRATVAGNGTWGCSLSALPDGPAVVVRAVSLDTGASAATRTIAVLSPPTISMPAGGLLTSGGINGTASPGATVTLRASNGASCSFPADSSGSWGCVLSPVPSGRFTVTATQRGPSSFPAEDSAPSAPVPVTFDTTPPTAPTIATPGPTTVHSGDPLSFGGAGETGSTVTVYASNDRGSSVICTGPVRASGWSCFGSVPPGSYLVSALQTDSAGNVSAGSNTVAITFTTPRPDAGSGSPPSSPSKTPKAKPGPAAPAAPPGTTPSPLPSPPSDAQRLPGMPGWAATPFTFASAPVVTAEAFPGWLRSLALAVAALLLLALPARLLAGTITRNRAEHGERRRAGIFGRNRSSAEIRAAEARLPRLGARAHALDHPAVDGPAAASTATVAPDIFSTAEGRWSTGAAFAAAAALVTLSSPVQDLGAYLRVIAAIGLAIIAVNAAWLALARWTAPLLGGGRIAVTFRPWLLLVVAAAAVGSRMFGLHPVLLFGLLLGAAFADGTDRPARGRISTIQVAGTALLGVLAWLTVGLLPTPAGVGSAFAIEFANSMALLALGSAAISLLPVGGLAGRAIYLWSPLVWIGLSLVVYTLLFALLLPVGSLVEAGASAPVLILAALGFAVLSLSVWLWERFVEPARE